MDHSSPPLIVVVGAGFGGMGWAARIHDAGYRVLIVERDEDLGGVWRTHANRYSTAQLIETDFRFDMPYEDGSWPRNHASRDEILCEARRFFAYRNFAPITRFGTAVERIELVSPGQYVVRTVRHGIHESIACHGVVWPSNGLGRVRRFTVPGEASFRGRVAYGVADELGPQDFADKHVAILGMSATAIEQARQAVASGAASVNICCRGYNTVLSRYGYYCMARRPIWKGRDALAVYRRAYTAIDRLDLLERMDDRGTTCEQRVLPSVSDFFFVAVDCGKIQLHRSASWACVSDGIELRDTQTRVRADLIVKCLGYENQHARRDEVIGASGSSFMYPHDDPGFALYNGVDCGAFDIVGQGMHTGSTLTLNQILVDIYLYYLRHRDRFHEHRPRFPIMSDYRIDGARITAFFEVAGKHLEDVAILTAHHLFEKARRTRERFEERALVQAYAAQWDAMYEQFSAGTQSRPYPFRARGRAVEGWVDRAVGGLIRRRYEALQQRMRVGEAAPSLPYPAPAGSVESATC